MIMNCAQYTGKCVCGREHTLETKMVVVEYNAIANFEKYMEQVGLAGKRRTVVYDTNVYRLTEGKHIPCDQEIVLDANGLRSEDILIERMMKDLDHPEVIVAFGAGTIMDFGRYPAYKLGIPFVAVPTLASSDGFTANICSVILEGQKKSIPMCAPILVVADLDIIKGAPTFHKPGNIHELDHSIGDLLRLIERSKKVNPFIGNRYHPDVRFYCAEREVRRLRPGIGDGVKKRGFAHIRQADNSKFHLSLYPLTSERRRFQKFILLYNTCSLFANKR